MKPEVKNRFRCLLSELEAIYLWDRIYLDSARTPDGYDVVSYRARQQRLMQIADELILLELELRGGVASRENIGTSKADSPQASRESLPVAILTRWPSRSNLLN